LSTYLTTSPRGSYSLIDSRTLKLVRQMDLFKEKIVRSLTTQLHKEKFEGLTPKQLVFMGELDCGANHASELARRLGITRQAVHKTIQELQRLGWLDVLPHPEYGNQKVIEFTIEGERMMSRARAHFATIDTILCNRFGEAALDTLEEILTSPAIEDIVAE